MKEKQRTTLLSVLLLLPSIVLVGVFVYGFIGNTIYISLTDWGHGAGSLSLDPVKNFIGLENYRQLFSGFIYSRFRQDLVNTVFYSLFLVVGALFSGFLFAVMLDRKLKNEGVFRTIILYPMALAFIVSGTIWRWLLAPSGGLNILPTFIGLPAIDFLWTSSKTSVLHFNWQNVLQIVFAVIAAVSAIVLARALRERVRSKRKVIESAVVLGISLLYVFVLHPLLPPILGYREEHGFNLATLGISIASVWQYSGYTMALYLAGLRSLPETIRESAQLDGANEFTYYLKIAIPNVRPITLSAVIVIAHISLKLFDLIYAMAGADNANTGHPSINMYLTTFRANNFSAGAAMAVVLFLLSALFIIPYLASSHRERRS
jgi:glucose/mannose transport system permease protein